MVEILTSWLNHLKNADHVGVTLEIYGNAKEAGISNEAYKAALATLAKAIEDEDIAYKKAQKDATVGKLRDTDKGLDSYMRGIKLLLRGHEAMPEPADLSQKAKAMLQLFKEYGFTSSESYVGEAAKVVNMFQDVEKRKADAEALGVWSHFEKAKEEALKVLALLDDRFDTMATRVAGEMKAARTATDAAVKQLYQVITSMQTIMPETKVTDLAKKLRAIEDYARIYYLKTGASRADDTPTAPPSSGGGTGGGDDEDDGMPPPGGGE